MPAEFAQLLNQPISAFIVIVAGYFAYRIAYTGKDTYHSTVDALFIIVGFATLAQSALTLSVQIALSVDARWAFEHKFLLQLLGSVFGFVLAIWVATRWRKSWAESLARWLRLKNVSYADRNVSAWETMIGRESAKPQDLFIKTINGDRYLCEELHKFSDEMFGPCVLGNDGSVGMYVTSVKEAADNEWTDVDPRREGWGPEFRIFPKEQIAEVRMRHGT